MHRSYTSRPQAKVPPDIPDVRQTPFGRLANQCCSSGFPERPQGNRSNGSTIRCLRSLCSLRTGSTSSDNAVPITARPRKLCLPSRLEGHRKGSEEPEGHASVRGGVATTDRRPGC